MNQLDVGGQILPLLVQANDARVGLKPDHPGSGLGKRSGQCAQAHTDLDHLIIGGESRQFDDSSWGAFVTRKKTAPSFLFVPVPALSKVFGG